MKRRRQRLASAADNQTTRGGVTEVYNFVPRTVHQMSRARSLYR